MKAYLLIIGNGWDLNIGKVRKVFVEKQEHSATAYLNARDYLEDWLAANGGKVYCPSCPEGDRRTGWEIGGSNFTTGEVQYRWRQDGVITERFVAVRKMEAE